MLVRTYLDRKAAGADDETLAGIREQIGNIADLPDGLDFQFLKTRLQDIAAAYGAENDITADLLSGKTAETRAQEIVEGSALASQAQNACGP